MQQYAIITKNKNKKWLENIGPIWIFNVIRAQGCVDLHIVSH